MNQERERQEIGAGDIARVDARDLLGKDSAKDQPAKPRDPMGSVRPHRPDPPPEEGMTGGKRAIPPHIKLRSAVVISNTRKWPDEQVPGEVQSIGEGICIVRVTRGGKSLLVHAKWEDIQLVEAKGKKKAGDGA